MKQTAYVDVCDDTSYAFRAKSLEAEAVAANIPAITTAGIYPGVSNGVKSEHKIPLAFMFDIVSSMQQVNMFNFSRSDGGRNGRCSKK